MSRRPFSSSHVSEAIASGCGCALTPRVCLWWALPRRFLPAAAVCCVQRGPGGVARGVHAVGGEKQQPRIVPGERSFTRGLAAWVGGCVAKPRQAKAVLPDSRRSRPTAWPSPWKAVGSALALEKPLNIRFRV
ncbi:unnamed protein product [Lampetra planeri]